MFASFKNREVKGEPAELERYGNSFNTTKELDTERLDTRALISWSLLSSSLCLANHQCRVTKA